MAKSTTSYIIAGINTIRNGEQVGMPELEFSKLHGLGNDFVVIDGINQTVALNPDRVRAIAHRHYGVGCDQLLVVENSERPDADFRYRIFNADGSEAEQCGNGARCFAAFVRRRGMTDKDEIILETLSGLLRVRFVDGGLLSVDMGHPNWAPAEIPFLAEHESEIYSLGVGGETVLIGVVAMGNPHAVLQVDNVREADVARLGPLIESHEAFPNRINVGFMEVRDPHHIRLRVFERGSGETLACGSGACAAVVAGRRQGLLGERVSVELPGGSLLIVWPGPGASVEMTGPAVHVFDGRLAW